MLAKIYDGDSKLVLSNEDVINENFIEIAINDESIIIGIDELFAAVKTFNGLKETQRKNDLYYKTLNNA